MKATEGSVSRRRAASGNASPARPAVMFGDDTGLASVEVRIISDQGVAAVGSNE